MESDIKLHVPWWLPSGFRAIALYPFIYVRGVDLSRNKVLINHERIHLAQQKELGKWVFYIKYVSQWITRFSYKNISFEKEAYENQYSLRYLENRRPHSYKDY